MNMKEMEVATADLLAAIGAVEPDTAIVVRQQIRAGIAEVRRAAGQLAGALARMRHVESVTKRKSYRSIEGWCLGVVASGAKSRAIEQQTDAVGTGRDDKEETNPATFTLEVAGKHLASLSGSAGRQLWKLVSLTRKGEYAEPFIGRQILAIVESVGIDGQTGNLTVTKEQKGESHTRVMEVTVDEDGSIRMLNPKEVKGLTEREASFSSSSSSSSSSAAETAATPEKEPEPEPGAGAVPAPAPRKGKRAKA